jgi:murein DD-endopeptidase MepM/ murein hydrolase activator NlpD
MATLALLCCAALAAPRPTAPTMISPVVWSALATPLHPVAASDGRVHLVYELQLGNASRYTVSLDRFDVLDGQDRPVRAVLQGQSADGQNVVGKVRPFGLPQPTQDAGDYAGELGPGQGGVVYLDLVFDRAADVPPQLRHRIGVSFPLPDKPRQRYTAIDAGIAVGTGPAVALAPPLRGDGWLVGNGSGAIVSPHRYTAQPTNGSLRAPEHFAIDFVRLDAQARAFAGDPTKVASWPGYGAEVVAVAPGTVASVRTGMADGVPGQSPSGLAPDEYAGNHVIVDLGGGRFALFAHLAPGSIAVKPGERVRAGQLLGRLGNTGNSDAPHLHFQIMNSNSVLDTDGLPFVFERMRLQGRLAGPLDSAIDALMAGRPAQLDAADAGLRRQQMPLTLDVVGFDAEPAAAAAPGAGSQR